MNIVEIKYNARLQAYINSGYPLQVALKTLETGYANLEERFKKWGFCKVLDRWVNFRTYHYIELAKFARDQAEKMKEVEKKPAENWNKTAKICFNCKFINAEYRNNVCNKTGEPTSVKQSCNYFEFKN